ncbi:hypothetical protein N665_0477s0015 [Sinapis alba]|nr:hypothetical protein N665_0477s0015 [Sinapis alba]
MEKPKFKTVQEVVAAGEGLPERYLCTYTGDSEGVVTSQARPLHKACKPYALGHRYGNDMILLDDQVLDWTDRLYLTTYPEDQQQLKFWPEVPIEFRDTLDEYTMKQQQLIEKFYKAITRSLELKDNRSHDMC